MNSRGMLFGMLLAGVFVAATMIGFEAAVWGASDDVPGYMAIVAVPYGLVCGIVGTLLGRRYL